jgi:hypothetical protein
MDNQDGADSISIYHRDQMQAESARNDLKFLVPILLVCSAIFLLRSFTLGGGPITWDEPIYLHGSQDYMHWAFSRKLFRRRISTNTGTDIPLPFRSPR